MGILIEFDRFRSKARAADLDVDRPFQDERDLYFAIVVSAIKDLNPINSAEYLTMLRSAFSPVAVARRWLLGLPYERGDPPVVSFQMCAEALDLCDLSIKKIQSYAFYALQRPPLEIAPGRKRKRRLNTIPFRKRGRYYTRKKRQTCT